MGSMRVLLSLLSVVVVVICAAPTARAGCWGDYVSGPWMCFGNGCNSQYYDTDCAFGCVSGTCNPDGDSQECCAIEEKYAQVFPDGGNGCGECGSIRARDYARVLHPTPEHRAELLQGHAPGLIMLSTSVSYMPPRLIYTRNRCNHKYGTRIENGRLITVGGM